MCTTLVELGPQNHDKDGLWGLIYSDYSGCIDGASGNLHLGPRNLAALKGSPKQLTPQESTPSRLSPKL